MPAARQRRSREGSSGSAAFSSGNDPRRAGARARGRHRCFLDAPQPAGRTSSRWSRTAGTAWGGLRCPADLCGRTAALGLAGGREAPTRPTGVHATRRRSCQAATAPRTPPRAAGAATRRSERAATRRSGCAAGDAAPRAGGAGTERASCRDEARAGNAALVPRRSAEHVATGEDPARTPAPSDWIDRGRRRERRRYEHRFRGTAAGRRRPADEPTVPTDVELDTDRRGTRRHRARAFAIERG
jgi:hypothetical protein